MLKFLADRLIFGLPLLTLFKLRCFIEAAIAATLGRGVELSIKYAFPVSRPPRAAELGEMSAAFPSGHATMSFAIASIVYYYNKKLGTLAFLLAGTISISRALTGYHWWADIIAGAALGTAAGWGTYKISHNIYKPQPRK